MLRKRRCQPSPSLAPLRVVGREKVSALVADAALGGIQVQRLEQAPDRRQEHDGEWQRAGDGRGLQRLEAIGEEQGDGHHAHQHRPKYPLPERRVVLAAGGQHVHHQRAGVGRGDEEHHHHQHRHQRNHAAQREVLEEGEQRHRTVLVDHFGQLGEALLQDHVDGGIAEHRHPQQGEAGRDEQHAADELADRAAARDTGDEQADEGRPGQPPAPVQQGPAADPVGGLVGVQVEGLVDDVGQVGPGVLHVGLQEEHGRPEDQHEEQQDHRQAQVQLGQDADAAVQSAGHRERGEAAGGGDQGDLHGLVHRPAEQVVQAAVDLQHAVAERSRHAEHGADDREDIHRVADGAVDTFADQRIQRRAQGQRQAVAIAEEGQDQRDDGVDRPGMQAPVEEGQLHRFLRRLHGVRLAYRWGGEVHHRFGNAEEHQTDAHAGGEQHGEPGGVAVVGTTVVGAELDVAVAADGEEHHADQDQRHGQYVEPAGVGDDPLLDVVEQRLRFFLEEHGEQHQGQDQGGGGIEDRRIQGAPGGSGCLHVS